MSSKAREVIRVLIPGVCHPVAVDTLENLRRASDNTLYIVGVDVEERGVDFTGIDVHYFVPPATSPDYIPAVLDIGVKERVQVVVPWSDDEVEMISSQAAVFKEAGIATLCGASESVDLALDKGTALQELQKRNIPVPGFGLASSADEIEREARRLGYPREKIVVKPRRGSGSRGMWILEEDVDMLQAYRGAGRRATLSSFLFIMRESEGAGRNVPDYVVMQFLPGEDYSVDALADAGEALLVVPRRRIKAIEGISHIGETTPEPAVRAMVARVIEAFNLHLNVNVQLRYSQIAGGQPLVYEINPRISGSIVANDAAGASLFYYGIRMAMGLPIPARDSIRVHETRMFRKWVGKFTRSDRWFNP